MRKLAITAAAGAALFLAAPSIGSAAPLTGGQALANAVESASAMENVHYYGPRRRHWGPRVYYAPRPHWGPRPYWGPRPHWRPYW